MSSSADETASQLQSATQGFDFLFGNEIADARKLFEDNINGGQDSPFHLLGLGVLTFLEAALGMESGLMVDASQCLALAEAGAKKQMKLSKSSKSPHRFQSGIEWEILHADAVVLLGLTHALSESYMGYMQCIAHSKFSKLYKTVFPSGLDAYATPSATPSPSRKPSSPSLRSVSTSSSNNRLEKKPSSFFGRWGSSLTVAKPEAVSTATDGPVEELIVAGTAFGFGLFNLVFSLLPAKIRSVVGFFGYDHDRKLALQALAVSAAKTDVHSVFAGLVLMTYYGVVLLLSGYQADETHIIKQYRAIVDRIEPRYPTGALWILNRAKIMRMSHDAEGAIRVLQEGLKPARPHTFAQADTLLVFELAWTLLAQRRYQDSADMFIKITELNSWSHATYYFIAAGCYVSMGNTAKAQELFNTIPSLLDKRRINGKELPTEALIRKKLAFYKQKQVKRGGNEAEYAQVIRISPAEEIAIFWNTHARIQKSIAEAHIEEWSSLSPPAMTIPPYTTPPQSPSPPSRSIDLDTTDELALRSLLLGIVYRTIRSFSASRAFLIDAHRRQPQIEVSTWIGGVALFELAVLDLREYGAENCDATTLEKVLAGASEKLDKALALANNVNADLSSRLDSRIAMLRDEIATKREMLTGRNR